MKSTNLVMSVVTLAVLLAGWVAAPAWCIAQTALDTYVAAPDASYGYSLAGTVNGAGYTGYQIDLTSQTWRSPSEITPNLWQHKMTITQPDTVVSSNTAILWIGGGTNPGGFSLLAAEALASGLVAVNLPTVPNQPLQFSGEAFTRVEDQIIAKTFSTFLDGGDDQWPLLLPMAKSVVRAMDATQDYMQVEQGVTIDNFIIMGASKRGWTTWLTAAVESFPGAGNRVSAIVPAVIDVLNMDESMAHHRRVYEGVTAKMYGEYTESVQDYTMENVFSRFDTPRGQELVSIVDPYEYRDRLSMPKYIVNSTGDQFFAPDSSRFFFDDLIGQNYLRYVPNTDHGLGGSDALEDILFFNRAVAMGAALPEFSWTVSADGSQILVDTVDAPIGVQIWQATNPVNRDFRVETFGANWSGSALVDQGGGQYVADVPIPATGATAFMVELEYLVNGTLIKFTTEVSVVQEPNADFDKDSDVDGMDFLTWQSNFGTTFNGMFAEGDSNVDRSIDAADLAVWEDQFGGVSPAATASVPEPSAFLLLLVGMVFVSCLRTCKRVPLTVRS